MITVGMNYNVRPGKEKEFEEKFDAVLAVIRSSPGHVDSRMFRDIHDTSSYLIVSEWSEQAKFTDFIRSDAFNKVTAWGKESILIGRPQHKIYKSGDDVGRHKD